MTDDGLRERGARAGGAVPRGRGLEVAADGSASRRAATTGTGGLLGGPARPAFTLTRLDPAPELVDVVERHWVVRWSLPPGVRVVQSLLPHACVNLVAERVPGAAGTGPTVLFAAHTMPAGRYDRVLEGTGTAFGTKFRPGGAEAFARAVHGARAAAQLGLTRPGRVVPAVHLLRPGADTLGRTALEAVEAGDVAGAVATVTEALTELQWWAERSSWQAHRARPPVWSGDRVLARVHEVFAAVVSGRLGPQARVEDLAEVAGMSVRSLQRLLRERVGVSPKWVLQRHRVQLAAELIETRPDRDLGEVAVEAGYYDQSHLTADFSALVGLTPGLYARRCAQAREAVSADA